MVDQKLLDKYNVNLDELKEDYDLVVFRCSGCVSDLLSHHNPYVYDDGVTQIPVEKIKIIEVKPNHCENTAKNMHANPQKSAPIALYKMRGDNDA